MLSGASLGITTAVGMCAAAAITLAGRVTPHDECVKAIPLIFLSAMATIPAGLVGAYLGARFGSYIGTYFSTLNKKIN